MAEFLRRFLVLLFGALVMSAAGCAIQTSQWRASFLAPSAASVSVYDDGVQDPVVVTGRRYVVQPTVSLYPFGYSSYPYYRNYRTAYRLHSYAPYAGSAYRGRVVHHHHHRRAGAVSRGQRSSGGYRSPYAHSARRASTQRGAAHGFSRGSVRSVPRAGSRGGYYAKHRRHGRR